MELIEFDKMIYKSKVQIFDSLKEKERLNRTTDEKYPEDTPDYYLFIFPKIVQEARNEFFLKFINADCLVIENYINILLKKLNSIIPFHASTNAPYMIAKEYGTAQEEMEKNNVHLLERNKSFVLMHCYDSDLPQYFDMNYADVSKYVFKLRRDLKYYYIKKALMPFYIELINKRGLKSDKTYVEEKEADFLFCELEFRYRQKNKSKQRFAYLYKYLSDIKFNEKLDYLKSNTNFKRFIEFKFNEKITNFNVKHSMPKVNKMMVSNKQYDTYSNEKQILDDLIAEIYEDYKYFNLASQNTL